MSAIQIHWSAEYPVTVHDNIKRRCPTCARLQVIYVQVVDGERRTCCGTCSRIIDREPVKK